MIARAKVYRALVAGCMSLSGIACAGSAVYVGVAVPAPWYGGYPYLVGPVGVIGRPRRVLLLRRGRIGVRNTGPPSQWPACCGLDGGLHRDRETGYVAGELRTSKLATGES